MTKPKKSVENNARATGPGSGGVTGKGFKPGQSGHPGGRPPVDPELKATIIADTPARYERLKALSEKAEQAGELKVAATIELALLKKVVPDTSVMLLGDTDGQPLRVLHIDPKSCTKEQLDVLISIQKAQAK